MSKTIGGGSKKVLYTLNTLRRIGLKNSTKALTTHNTCKACGYGMGGQKGGMTNELNEFPSVCNKSIQAQSTDIQPPIPSALFSQHNLEDFQQLSAHELEHLGRLGHPLHKPAGSNHYKEVSWDWALDYSAQQFKSTDPQRTFFYSSGRSSNEAGFLLQLFARVYGTNNVNNCSFYCHQATAVGLGSTIGTGTATIELEDLGGSDLIFVIGANPASNHPRFIYQLQACRERGGHVVVINPAKEPGLVKFALPKSARSMILGGSDIASHYLQPHIGGDIALIKGIAKAVLEMQQQDIAFIKQHCTNFSAFESDLQQTSWSDIEHACGLTQERIIEVAQCYAQAKNVIFAWGMGLTHHQFGSENIEYIANLALLRGMVGKRYAGLLPLRGHSNVQGIGTIGVKPVLADEVFERIESQLDIKLPRKPGYDTLGGLQAASRGEIDAACLVGGNLFGASPNSAWSQQALDRIPFKLFLTTTLNQGHIHGIEHSEAIVLPVTARDEEPQSTTQESMFSYVRLSDGGIERLADVRSEVSILSELAQRVIPQQHLDFSAFGDHEHIRQTIAKTVPGMEALKDIGIAKQEFHVKGRQLHTQSFNTANRKADFKVHPIPPLRKLHAKPNAFRLATIRSEGQFNTIIYQQTDSYRNNAPRWSVLMSPSDMETLQLHTGDKVTLRSPSGSMENLSVQAFDLPAGNLLAYYPEANVLTGCDIDPRSRTPNFKSIGVEIEVLGKGKKDA